MGIPCSYCQWDTGVEPQKRLDIAAMRHNLSLRCACRLSPETLRGLLAGDASALEAYREHLVCWHTSGGSMDREDALQIVQRSLSYPLTQQRKAQITHALHWHNQQAGRLRYQRRAEEQKREKGFVKFTETKPREVEPLPGSKSKEAQEAMLQAALDRINAYDDQQIIAFRILALSGLEYSLSTVKEWGKTQLK